MRPASPQRKNRTKPSHTNHHHHHHQNDSSPPGGAGACCSPSQISGNPASLQSVQSMAASALPGSLKPPTIDLNCLGSMQTSKHTSSCIFDEVDITQTLPAYLVRPGRQLGAKSIMGEIKH